MEHTHKNVALDADALSDTLQSDVKEAISQTFQAFNDLLVASQSDTVAKCAETERR